MNKRKPRVGEVVIYYCPLANGKPTPNSLKNKAMVVDEYRDYYLLEKKTAYGDYIKDTILKKDIYCGAIVVEKGTYL